MVLAVDLVARSEQPTDETSATAGEAGTTGRQRVMRIEWGLSGLLMAGVAAVGLSATTPAAAEDQLNVVSWGGAYQESQREAFFKPFAKDTSTKITEDRVPAAEARVWTMLFSRILAFFA